PFSTLIVTGGCTGCVGASNGSLSALTSATVVNSIDSTNFAQTWAWGTLSTQTAFSLVTSSMTTGTVLNLTNSATGNNAGTVLAVTNKETGASFGVNVSSATTAAGYGM